MHVRQNARDSVYGPFARNFGKIIAISTLLCRDKLLVGPAFVIVVLRD